MNAGHHLADMTAAATNTVVTFSRRASSSVGPHTTPRTPSHSAPRAELSARRRPVGAPPMAAHEYLKRHRSVARSLPEASRPWDGGH